MGPIICTPIGLAAAEYLKYIPASRPAQDHASVMAAKRNWPTGVVNSDKHLVTKLGDESERFSIAHMVDRLEFAGTMIHHHNNIMYALVVLLQLVPLWQCAKNIF